MADIYSATWLSHSSISAFLACPRAYFLANRYKDPKTNRKLGIVSPALSLGSAVHKVIEDLSEIPVEERFKTSLIQRFETEWREFTGKQGGFVSATLESEMVERGRVMLEKVMRQPGPVGRKAIKIKQDLPQYWLSESDELMLCGKIDWLEYLPEEDAVAIVDFKTSRTAEASSSLQLPIYMLLVSHLQTRPIKSVSYWYLELADLPEVQPLPDLVKAEAELLAIGKKMRLARKLNHFVCPEGAAGCRHCRPYEAILRGEADYLGERDRKDMYLIAKNQDALPEVELL